MMWHIQVCMFSHNNIGYKIMFDLLTKLGTLRLKLHINFGVLMEVSYWWSNHTRSVADPDLEQRGGGAPGFFVAFLSSAILFFLPKIRGAQAPPPLGPYPRSVTVDRPLTTCCEEYSRMWWGLTCVKLSCLVKCMVGEKICSCICHTLLIGLQLFAILDIYWIKYLFRFVELAHIRWKQQPNFTIAGNIYLMKKLLKCAHA